MSYQYKIFNSNYLVFKGKSREPEAIFNGFNEGYTVKEILGVRMIEGDLHFALKWYAIKLPKELQ